MSPSKITTFFFFFRFTEARIFNVSVIGHVTDTNLMKFNRRDLSKMLPLKQGNVLNFDSHGGYQNMKFNIKIKIWVLNKIIFFFNLRKL